MKRKNIYILVVALLFSFVGFTQNPKQDIIKINKAYKETPFIKMNVKYSFYLDKDVETPSMIKHGKYIKNKKNIYSSIQSTKTIQNSKYMFVVDKESKMIIISKPKINFETPLEVGLDSMLKICSKVEFTQPTKQLNQYRFVFKNSRDYKSIDIMFNKLTFFVERVRLNFKTPMPIDVNDENSVKKIPKVEITYSNINTTQPTPLSFFSETPFFSYKDNAFISNINYKEYSLINNIVSK